MTSNAIKPQVHGIFDPATWTVTYVVYEKNYEKKINFIRSWFLKNNIVLLGRFSFFEYINIDMAVDRSLEIYKQLNNIKTTKKKILIQALNRCFNE